jgi:hypothetical protein
MKKLFLVFVILLTSCAANQTVRMAFSPAGTQATPDAVCSYLATQMIEQQCSYFVTPTPTTQTPVTVTPAPTVSPTPTSVPVKIFDPTNEDIIPLPGIYQVGPLNNLAGSLCKADDYTVKNWPNTYLPATCWAEQHVVGKAALNWTYTPTNLVIPFLQRLGNSAWAVNYSVIPSNGADFSSGFRNGLMYPSTPTHPNTVDVYETHFFNAAGEPGQWYGYVRFLSDTAQVLNNIDISTIPTYELQWQSDQSYSGLTICGSCLMGVGKDNLVPLLGNPGDIMVIPLSQLLNIQVQQ